jgi:hypothetical protein
MVSKYRQKSVGGNVSARQVIVWKINWRGVLKSSTSQQVGTLESV